MARNEARVRFVAETSKFNEGIDDAKSTITRLNSELKLNAQALKESGSSAELLQGRVDLLSQKHREQEAVVDALRQKLEVAKRVYGESSNEVKRLEASLNNAQATLNSYASQVDRASSQMRSADSALGALESSIKSQESELSRLEREYANAILQFGRGSAEAKSLETRMSGLSNELRASKQRLGEAELAARQLSGGLSEARAGAQQAGDSIGDLAGSVAALAASAAGIGGVAEYVNGASDASARLEAALVGSSAEMGRFGQVVQELYASNPKKTFDELSEAASRVVQVMGNDISPEQLKSCVASAMTLSDTFDIDVGESVKAARVMMQNFGIDSEAAFDLIAKGAQEGLNINEDMLDSFSEYSPYFAQLGLDATDMFNAFAAGAEVSMYGVDKAGDAFKEFGIRVVDGSETTKQAFADMGLSADEYAQRIMAGGDSAKAATGEIIGALLAIEDPVQRNITGVSLFGTQWEDLGQDGAEAMLSLMGRAVEAEGALQRIDGVRYDNVGDSITGVGRTLETGLLQPLTTLIEPAFSGFASFFQQNFSTIAPVIVGVAVAVGVLATALLVQGVGSLAAFGAALAVVTGPVGIAAAAIGAVVGVIMYLWNTNEGFRAAVGEIWAGIQQTFETTCAALEPIVRPAFEAVLGVVDSIMNSGLVPIVTGALQVISGIFQTVCGFIVGVATGDFSMMSDGVAGIMNGLSSMIDGAIAAIVQFFAGPLSAVEGIASGIFEGVRRFIEDPIGAARDTVGGFVGDVVGFFTGLGGRITSAIGSIHFPTPHVSWQTLSVFGMDTPISLPHVEWYARGGIMTAPTLFGVNGGRAMVGGEAGPEAILPISMLQGFIDAAFERHQGQGSTYQYIINELDYTGDAVVEEAVKAVFDAIGKANRAYGRG